MQLLYNQVCSVVGNIPLIHIDNEILGENIFTKECTY